MLDADLLSLIKTLRETPDDSAAQSRFIGIARRTDLLVPIIQQFIKELTPKEWEQLVAEEENRRLQLAPENWVVKLKMGDSVWLPREQSEAVIVQPFQAFSWKRSDSINDPHHDGGGQWGSVQLRRNRGVEIWYVSSTGRGGNRALTIMTPLPQQNRKLD